MRGLDPAASGFAVNPHDGVRIAYEVFGSLDAERTIVFIPTWILIHSRNWKAQVPYFAQRGFRVVTYDGRGNGKSDRPATGYTDDDFTRDMVAVFDELAVERAAVIGVSAGAGWGIQFAAQYPERVTHLVLSGASVNLRGPLRSNLDRFLTPPPDTEGWNTFNAVYWRQDFEGWVAWFARQVFSDPHSAKAIEDVREWSRGTTVDIVIQTIIEDANPRLPEFARAVACPTLLIHGSDDQVTPDDFSRAIHEEIAGSRLVIVDGAGHGPQLRDPVRVNLTIHDFLGREQPGEWHWPRAQSRTKRALFVSSPIGLGHAQRDLAIADALRSLVPGLQIDWLAQPPVTTLLEARGECIHPLSSRLAGESAHIESEQTGEHELPVFDALHNMDEILLANFFVFLDAVRETPYDLWIGDEAWEIDHFLHENPELKTAPFAWLTDFVGYLPADPSGESERERFLTADYNAELIEQRAHFPWVRDVSLFVGNPDDALPESMGPGLPSIRDWTVAQHDFTGYIRSFDPEALGDRAALRARFGFQPDEQVAVAAVGGTTVGSSLLRRIVDAYPIARDLVPGLRLVVVCGPRIDPGGLPRRPGIEYHGYVHNLYEMLAASDVGLVQGGLSTTMELVAARRPFLYFPLQQHFEQQRHVAYRLERYGVPAWARMQYPGASPRCIAERLVRALREPVAYRPVEAGGARRAAEKIAALIQ